MEETCSFLFSTEEEEAENKEEGVLGKQEGMGSRIQEE